jgi:HK97 family phage prohead protease
MGSNIETRARVMDAQDGNTIIGYAAVFHSEAVIAGEFREKISPGAFADTLRRNDVLALFHHDSARILGRMSAGTLRLAEDAKGLHCETDADPSTPDGATALGVVRRREVRGMSFGFRVLAENWSETRGLPLRTLTEIELVEVTLTGFPAYEETSAALRSLERWRGSNAAVRAKMKFDVDARLRGFR